VGGTWAVSTGLLTILGRMSHKHYDVGVIVSEAGLRELLFTAGINDSNIWRDDNVGRARTFRRRRIAEHQVQVAAVKDFAAVGADCGGTGLKQCHVL
jgi:hypothetical protein